MQTIEKSFFLTNSKKVLYMQQWPIYILKPVEISFYFILKSAWRYYPSSEAVDGNPGGLFLAWMGSKKYILNKELRRSRVMIAGHEMFVPPRVQGAVGVLV